MPRRSKTKIIGGVVLSAVLTFGTACSPLADTLRQKKAEYPSAELTEEKPITASSIRWMLLQKDNVSVKPFDRLIENPNLKPELLPKVKLIIEKADENAGHVLDALDSLLNNPSFKPEMLTDEFIQKFIEVTNLVWEGGCLVMDYSNLLENSRFTPEDTLDITKLIIKKTEKYGEYHVFQANHVFQFLNSIQKNPNFNPGMRVDFIKLLIEKSENTKPVLDALKVYLEYPHFKERFLTEDFAEELVETVELIIEKNGGVDAAFNDLNNLKEILANPNFSSLGMVYFYVEKINDKKMLWILKGSLDKSGFEMSEEYAEKLVKILNYIIDNTDENNRKDALSSFYSIQNHSNFIPEMLDVVEHIIEKIDKTVGLTKIGQVIPILYLISDDSDPSEICTMEFAENFTEAVIALTEKSNEIGCNALGLLDALVRNPNFEPKTLNGELTKDLIGVLDVSLFNAGYVEDGLSDEEKELVSDLIFHFENGLESLLRDPKFIPKALGILERLVGGSEDQDNAIHNFSSLLSNPDFTTKAYEKMDEVQLELFVEQKLNFAYAFSTIGKEKTMVLYEKCGIKYFGRYSKEMLEEAYASLVPEYKKDRPLLVVVFNQSDDDGAFYYEREMLDDLRKYYKVMLFEACSDKEFNKIIKKTANQYKKIDTLIIGGHGDEDSIELGLEALKEELNYLDLTDKNELKNLKKYFVNNPTVVLISCSTGHGKKSFGKLLSKIWNATVWAPDKPVGLKEFVLTEEGKIDSAIYSDDATKKFENGKTRD